MGCKFSTWLNRGPHNPALPSRQKGSWVWTAFKKDPLVEDLRLFAGAQSREEVEEFIALHFKGEAEYTPLPVQPAWICAISRKAFATPGRALVSSRKAMRLQPHGFAANQPHGYVAPCPPGECP